MGKKKQRRQLPPGMTYADVLAMQRRQVEAVRQAAIDDAVQIRADVHVQRLMWLMVVSVADAFGLGPQRMARFFETLQQNSDEMEAMTADYDFEYALDKLRQKAEAVTGAEINYAHEKEFSFVRELLKEE